MILYHPKHTENWQLTLQSDRSASEVKKRATVEANGEYSSLDWSRSIQSTRPVFPPDTGHSLCVVVVGPLPRGEEAGHLQCFPAERGGQQAKPTDGHVIRGNKASPPPSPTRSAR